MSDEATVAALQANERVEPDPSYLDPGEPGAWSVLF
jgi:hypothetical protein